MKLISIALAFTFYLGSSVAGVKEDLGKFFDDMGVASNVTTAGSYETQSGGFLSGGSLHVRAPVRNQQLVSMQLPNINVGCGGIDIQTGGLSYINSREFVNTLKSIGTGAASYAFMLGLQTVTPSIEGLLSKLKTAAQWANQLSINSCDAGAALVGGLALTNQTLSKKYCETAGMQTGMFSDMVAARHQCNDRHRRASANDSVSRDRGFKDIVKGTDYNVAWLVINKHPFLKSQSEELKQLYMSLSGTLIANGDQRSSLASLAKDGILDVIMQGGSANIYKCNETEKCLIATKDKKMTIPEKDSMIGKANRLLSAIALSIKNDRPLATRDAIADGSVSIEEAKAFLNSTSLPIYRMLNITTAVTQGITPLNIHEYSTVIAWDILYRYVLDILEAMESGSDSLNEVQFSDDIFPKFKQELTALKQDVASKRAEMNQKTQMNTRLVHEVRAMEQQLASQIDFGDYLT